MQQLFNWLNIFFLMSLSTKPILSFPNALNTTESSVNFLQTEVTATSDSKDPPAHIQTILNEYPQYFNKDLHLASLSSRSVFLDDDAIDFKHLCQSEGRILMPVQIKNKAGKFVKVVNYPGYAQRIYAEPCLDADLECSYSDYIGTYSSVCKQKYSFRRMLTFDPESDQENPKFIESEVPIPAGCECVLIQK